MNGRTRAFTLIEVLVVVAVVGLVVALLLPAVQSAREAARRLRCMGNLKQMALAMHEYEAAFAAFPTGMTYWGYSLHAETLPNLELSNLYDAINFSSPPTVEFYTNTFLYPTSVSIFVCPSDPLAGRTSFSSVTWPGTTNYAGCMGDDRVALESNGVFPGNPIVGPRDVVDGLSNTVALSEFLVGRRDEPERLRSYFEPGDGEPHMDLAAFAARCGALAGMSPNLATVKGSTWALGQRGATLYNHVMPPNSPSCSNGNGGLSYVSAETATGRHPGGVLCAFADGRVKFISNGINVSTWRAIGTRDGGEAYPPGDY